MKWMINHAYMRKFFISSVQSGSFSQSLDFVTPLTVAHQAPWSITQLPSLTCPCPLSQDAIHHLILCRLLPALTFPSIRPSADIRWPSIFQFQHQSSTTQDRIQTNWLDRNQGFSRVFYLQLFAIIYASLFRSQVHMTTETRPGLRRNACWQSNVSAFE